MLESLLIACLFFLSIIHGHSDPFQPTDNFVSPCTFLSDPPSNGFQRWSNPNTWGGTIPGVNQGINFNVTIPCGVAILLDVPSIQLHTLRIQGFLKFLDDPSLPSVLVRSHYILVEGQLTIGSPSRQFRSTVRIELTPNVVGGRANLLFTSISPAEPSHPRNLGHKAFAVVGGQVHLHGLSVSPDMPVWARLARTAKIGDVSLALDQTVSWPVGSEIVVASTDYSASQTEVFQITSRVDSLKGSEIGLNKAFQFMHYGDALGLSDGFGGYINQCAEVALLSRNIIITGTDEPSPFQFEGGHFIIFQTQIQQFIEGVDFQDMGQQGLSGRYPIHFHLIGNQAGGASGTVCRKNTIRRSKQRCIVVHASFGLTIEENVAFNTLGHCFMTEEGGETNNYFIRNIGISIKPVSKLIPIEAAPNALPETDDKPSVFWMSNPNNHLIGNVAAGSTESGIWFELQKSVRGLSRIWDAVNKIIPKESPLGTMSDNTVHSNKVGLRFYPHGLMPKVNGVRVNAYIVNLNSYKNSWMGTFSHRSDGLIFQNATLADNQVAIWMNVVQANILNASRVVGHSDNLGTPQFCRNYTYRVGCAPTVSCSLPLPTGELGRSISWNWRTLPLTGVRMQQHAGGETGYFPNAITSTTFSNFNAACSLAASIILSGSSELRYWSTALYTRNLQFTSNSNRIWFPPPYASSPPTFIGEQANFFTMRDVDGSLIGSPGYAVAKNDAILPTDPAQCTFQSKWNAYACPNTCYRSIAVEYPEPDFINVVNGKLGDFSSILITRVEDGKYFQVDGNYVVSGTLPEERSTFRYFYFNILAGMTYSITVKNSVRNPSFYPKSITIRYKDGVGCGKGVTFRVPPPASYQWVIVPSRSIFYRSCTDPPSGSTYMYICNSGVSLLEISDLPSSSNSVTVVPIVTSTTCLSTTECGIMNIGSPGWRYDVSGLELRPNFLVRNYDDSSWTIGTTPFGNRNGVVSTLIPAPSVSRLTYYYRKAFVLNSASCYRGMNMDVTFQDGIVMYLNQVEIYRANMPTGSIKNSTKASSMNAGDFRTLYRRLTFSLEDSSPLYFMDGINILIAEVHASAWNSRLTAFDVRVSALKSNGACNATQIPLEVCDGIDNDFDGLVDEDVNGKPLTQACSSRCGAGIEFCVSGNWVNCTASQSTVERCNNLDDNCDGLVDNGLGQLDCAPGNACYNGACVPIIPMTRPASIWGPKSNNWSFSDQGLNFDTLNTSWKNGSSLDMWSIGTAPLGNNIPGLNFGTIINPPRKAITTYFRKSFTMTPTDILNAYSIGVRVLRDDGVVVYLNGFEIFRDNMPNGPVNWNTLASRSTVRNSLTNSKSVYYNCTGCFQNTTLLLEDGENIIAAEVHQFARGNRDVAFDLELFQNVLASCSDVLGSPNQPCIRAQPKANVFFGLRSDWRYSDSYLPLPTSDWITSSFSDSNWLYGNGSFGNSNPGITTFTNAAKPSPIFATQYFRKTFFIQDPSCYFELNHTLYAKFGAAVYINGVEAYRLNLPAGSLSSDTLATFRNWNVTSTILSSKWLVQGTNVIAIELHNVFKNSINAFFDSFLTAKVTAECALVG